MTTIPFPYTSPQGGALSSLGNSPISEPGGRICLTTATPVHTSTVSAQGTVFYTPYKHNLLPIQAVDGGVWTLNAFAEMSQALTDATKSPAAALANSNYDIFAWNDAGTLRATRGPAWTETATVTMTIANPCVVTYAGHGLLVGEFVPVVFSTTGALPNGGTTNIVAGTVYYTIPVDANTFQLSTTPGGAAISTLGGAQSGVHTAVVNTPRTSRGTGSGTTELKRVAGIWVNANAITNGPGVGLGTYLGTIRTNATATADFNLGSSAAGGGTAILAVWNCYNRVNVQAVVIDSTFSYTYTSNGVQPANNNTANRAYILQGLAEDEVNANNRVRVTTTAAAGAFAIVGIGVNSVTSFGTTGAIFQAAAAAATTCSLNATYEGIPGLGWYYLQKLEQGDNTHANTFNDQSGYNAFHVRCRC